MEIRTHTGPAYIVGDPLHAISGERKTRFYLQNMGEVAGGKCAPSRVEKIFANRFSWRKYTYDYCWSHDIRPTSCFKNSALNHLMHT